MPKPENPLPDSSKRGRTAGNPGDDGRRNFLICAASGAIGSASAAGYTQALAASPTPQTTKLHEPVNVLDFGARGDGVSSDRAAIQAALDHVAASGGGTVYFPGGTYLLESAINPASNTVLLGSGYASRLTCRDSGWPALTTPDNFGLISFGNKSNIIVQRLGFYGATQSDDVKDYRTGGTRTPKMIYFQDSTNVLIADCHFEHCAYEGIWQGGKPENNRNIRIVNNSFLDCGYPNPFTGLPAIQCNFCDGVILGNYLERSGTAIGLSGSGCSVVGNVIKFFKVVGIGTGDGGRGGSNVISGNVVHFDTAFGGTTAIRLDGGTEKPYGQADQINVIGNAIRLINRNPNANPVAIQFFTAREANVCANTIDATVRGRGFQLEGKAGGRRRAVIQNNIFRLTERGGVSNGFGCVSTAGEGPLFVLSRGNQVFGMTADDWPFDYTQTGTGLISVIAQDDYFDDGWCRYGTKAFGGATSLKDQLISYRSDVSKNLSYGSSRKLQMLTIEAGARATVSSGVLNLAPGPAGPASRSTRIVVVSASGANRKELSVIDGGQPGDLVILSIDNALRGLVVRSGQGNLRLAGDFSFAGADDRLTIHFENGQWYELGRSRVSQ